MNERFDWTITKMEVRQMIIQATSMHHNRVVHGAVVGIIAAFTTGFLAYALDAERLSSVEEKNDYVFDRSERLTDQQAAELKSKLKANSNDLHTRLRLINYYWRASLQSKEGAAAHAAHVMWVVEHKPECRALDGPESTIDHILNPEAYSDVKKLWLKQVREKATSAQVRANAANFVYFDDSDLAISLLIEAEKLDPKNTEWPCRLARDYSTGLYEAKDHVERGRKALAAQERAAALAPKADRMDHLIDLAQIAADADDFANAEKYGHELQTRIELDTAKERTWNYGNAIHKVHIVLGRVALHKGDIAAAKDHLLKAGDTPGSPQLNSFGPNISLAKELLTKGERDVVLAYFEKCRKFWKRDELDEWSKAVQAGQIPDFGANVDY
jgi:hypothetical protein